MKKRELERKLVAYGWWLKRQGSNHEIWTNGFMEEPIPRHREIGESLARKIIRKAEENPPREEQ